MLKKIVFYQTTNIMGPTKFANIKQVLAIPFLIKVVASMYQRD